MHSKRDVLDIFLLYIWPWLLLLLWLLGLALVLYVSMEGHL